MNTSNMSDSDVTLKLIDALRDRLEQGDRDDMAVYSPQRSNMLQTAVLNRALKIAESDLNGDTLRLVHTYPLKHEAANGLERAAIDQIGKGDVGLGYALKSAPKLGVAAALAPVIGAVGGAMGDSGALRGSLRGAGIGLGGMAGVGLGGVLSDAVSNLDAVKSMSPTAQSLLTVSSLLGGGILGGALGYKGMKALSKTDKEKLEEEKEKRASYEGSSDVQDIRDAVRALGDITAKRREAMIKAPGIGGLDAYGPAIGLAAMTAPVIGAVSGGFGDAGVVRGGLRGVGTSAGILGGAMGGGILAQLLASKVPDKYKALVGLLGVAGGAGLGGLLGHGVVKSVSKSDKEEAIEAAAERARQKQASAYPSYNYLQSIYRRRV